MMLQIKHWLGIKDWYKFMRHYHISGKKKIKAIVMCTEIEAKEMCHNCKEYHDTYKKIEWLEYTQREEKEIMITGFNLIDE